MFQGLSLDDGIRIGDNIPTVSQRGALQGGTSLWSKWWIHPNMFLILSFTLVTV